jgi:membrane protein
VKEVIEMKLKEIWGLIRETFQEWSEDKAPRLAAALSYYTAFSLAPLLVLVIAIAGFIIGNNETIRNQLLTQVQALAGSRAGDAINQLITNTSQPRAGLTAIIIGIATLLLGATGMLGQLQDALNTIWEVAPKKGRGIKGIVKDRIFSFAMVLGISFLLLVSLSISAVLSIINHYFASLLGGAVIIAQVVNILISMGVITLIFALIFKFIPDAHVEWRDVWIGAIVTALLFTIGKSLLGLYLGNSATTSAYGAAASLVVLLLWVYYSAQILFLGAEFTQVFARHTRSQIVPNENARPVTETERAHQGVSRREPALQRVQEVMVPVTGQPDIHPATGSTRSRVRYEPPNSDAVVPVIAAGALAGIYTVIHIIRIVISLYSS